MVRVRYKASRSAPYNGAGGCWLPGDEREVDDQRARWLLGPMGEWFEAVEPVKEAPPVAEGVSPSRAFTRGKKK